MSKLSDIMDGWKNYVFPDKHTEKVAKARASICSTCPRNQMNICKECGCPLVSKTRSMSSSCPINKW
jgi:hypothetical protein